MLTFHRLAKGTGFVVLATTLVVALQARTRKGDKLLVQSRAAELRKEWDKAMSLAEQALSEDPAEIAYQLTASRLRFYVGQFHVEQGLKLRDQGQLENALVELEKGYGINPASTMAAEEIERTKQMIEREVNTPLTSSCGRLFDAVAAVVLGRGVVDYEAQAAIELEGLAVDEPDELGAGYRLEMRAGNWQAREPARISAARLWRELLEDLRAGVNKARIAARFHAGVAASFIATAKLARSATGIAQVALSGGCLHNRRLAYLLREGLGYENFEVYQHRSVSPGDGGLSYGQAVVGAARLRG